MFPLKPVLFHTELLSILSVDYGRDMVYIVSCDVTHIRVSLFALIEVPFWGNTATNNLDDAPYQAASMFFYSIALCQYSLLILSFWWVLRIE